MAKNLPRKYIDLIHGVSGEWSNWDSPIPVHLGDFGTLDENGEFIVDGNIYSNEFQQYLNSFNLNAYPAKFTAFDQNYTTLSSGVKREQLDIDKFVDVPGISSSAFKETWTFQDGKRGALLILISSYTLSIPEIILAGILKVERLEGKNLVTRVRICPAYLKLLSDTSEETISVAFCPPPSKMDVVNAEGAGWWTDVQSELLLRDTQPHGRPIFTPLFSLKQREGSRWQNVYPTWGHLDEDAVRDSTALADSADYNTITETYESGNLNIRQFIDLVRKASGKWTNFDPPIPVTVGSYGTLDKNGEFSFEGNIYSDEFQQYVEENGFNFIVRDYRPRLAEPDQDYIVASSGVTIGQFNPDQQTNPAIASASIKRTFKFRNGKRGALIMIVNPRTSFIPNEIMAKILNVELLRGKHLVTNALACPAYLMYLSSKSGESLSVAFCAQNQGDALNRKVVGKWWTDGEVRDAALRTVSHPDGEYRYVPLFALKQTLKQPLFKWRADEEQHTGEEYSWHDVYPDWKPLDEDGEELDD